MTITLAADLEYVDDASGEGHGGISEHEPMSGLLVVLAKGVRIDPQQVVMLSELFNAASVVVRRVK